MLPHELIRVRCWGAGQLVITETAIIIEHKTFGTIHRDIMLRSALIGVDIKRLFTVANIIFSGQGKKMQASMVNAKDAKRIQALLLGL